MSGGAPGVDPADLAWLDAFQDDAAQLLRDLDLMLPGTKTAPAAPLPVEATPVPVSPFSFTPAPSTPVASSPAPAEPASVAPVTPPSLHATAAKTSDPSLSASAPAQLLSGNPSPSQPSVVTSSPVADVPLRPAAMSLSMDEPPPRPPPRSDSLVPHDTSRMPVFPLLSQGTPAPQSTPAPAIPAIVAPTAAHAPSRPRLDTLEAMLAETQLLVDSLEVFDSSFDARGPSPTPASAAQSAVATAPAAAPAPAPSAPWRPSHTQAPQPAAPPTSSVPAPSTASTAAQADAAKPAWLPGGPANAPRASDAASPSSPSPTASPASPAADGHSSRPTSVGKLLPPERLSLAGAPSWQPTHSGPTTIPLFPANPAKPLDRTSLSQAPPQAAAAIEALGSRTDAIVAALESAEAAAMLDASLDALAIDAAKAAPADTKGAVSGLKVTAGVASETDTTDSDDGLQESGTFFTPGGSEDDSLDEGAGDAKAAAAEPEAPRVDSMTPEEKALYRRFKIAEELVTTERTYVNTLRVIKEVFADTLTKANTARSLVPPKVLSVMFCGIPELYSLNSAMLAQLEQRLAAWQDDRRICDVFVQLTPFLKMYKLYIQNFDEASNVMDEWCRKSSAFASIIKECESDPGCRGLTIRAALLEPVQRLPRYKLLLQDYLKYTPEGDRDHKSAQDALEMVGNVATFVNEGVRQMENFQKLLAVQASLVGYDKSLVVPGRTFVRDGRLLKMCRKGPKPRMFFLFSDCLIYASFQPLVTGASQTYTVHLTIPLQNMRVRDMPYNMPDAETGFQVVSSSKSFSLYARTDKEKAEWMADLRKTIDEFASRVRSFTSSAQQQQHERALDRRPSRPGGGIDPSALGREAPVWVPDSGATMCMQCASEFTLIRRRHHCRACGKIVCGSCSEGKAPLAYLEGKPARVCGMCMRILGNRARATSAEYTSEMIQNPLLAMDAEAAKGGGGGAGVVSDKRSRRSSDGPGLIWGEEDATAAAGGDEGAADAESARRASLIKKARKRSLVQAAAGLTQTEHSQMCGYLTKQGEIVRSWKRRWFVLRNLCMYYYKAPEDVVAIGMIPLPSYHVSPVEKTDGIEREFAFKIFHSGMRTYYLAADSEDEMLRWIRNIELAARGDLPEDP